MSHKRHGAGTVEHISPTCNNGKVARVRREDGSAYRVDVEQLVEVKPEPAESSVESFFDVKKMRKFLEQSIAHYAKGPGWFTDWLDELYIRLSEDWQPITLDEIMMVAKLHDDDGWMPEPLAVNNAYKLFDRLKRDTSGILGY